LALAFPDFFFDLAAPATFTAAAAFDEEEGFREYEARKKATKR
jgi:hypothetical protein